MIEAVAQLLFVIAQALLEALVHLFALLFSSTWFATRSRGLARWGFTLAAIGAAYLLFGILRFLVPALETPGLIGLYSWPLVASGIVLTVLALALPDFADHLANGATRPGERTVTVMVFAYGMAFVVVFGGLSMLTSQKHNASLRDRACAMVDAQIDPALRDKAEQGVGLFNRLFRADDPLQIPCTVTLTR